MSSEPITDSPDSLLQAALAEFLERIDRGEAVDRKSFLAKYPDLAAELAPLLETGDALGQIGGTDGEPRTLEVSTHSQLSHDIETIAPGRKGQKADTSGPLPAEFGRYRVIKPLGQGAMGVVYLAEDTQLHRKVALKTSSFDDDQSGELLERFYREARSAATLRHPNICPVYDVGEIQDRHYISMAYIEGRTLATYVNATGSLHERQVLVLVRKLALALQDAHQQEIVHRDLKPANIMVDLKGEPIIMDFGLARVGYSEEESRLTQVGMIVGSPAYMSPEQVGGRPELLTGAADQYSLGVILFELLTGHPPFRGPVTAVVGQILTQPPPRLSSLRSDVSPAVEAMCLKMLAKSPSDRFTSMKHVADEIAALLRGSSAEKGVAASEKQGSPATSIPKTSLHEALVEEARQRLKKRDYPKAIEMLQRIPEAERAPEAAKLLAQALKLMDEVNFVLQEMEAALQSRDGATLAKRAQELVKLKPDHPRARQVRELIKKHGPERALQFLAENSGTTPAPPVDRGSQRRVGLIAGVIVVLLLGIVIWFGSGKTRLKVTVNDPTIEVTFRGSLLSIRDGASQVDVEPGEQELTIRVAGVEFQTPKFSLKKGTTSVVEVERADDKLAVSLGGAEVAAWPLGTVATAPPTTTTESLPTRPSVGPGSEIDLLAAVDVAKLGDSDMRWERRGQALVCTGTGAAGKSAWKGFRFPTEIGDDYEVELEFQQRAFWPMQIDFPLQDTAVRVSLTGDSSDLMIEDDKTQPNAERTWRSTAAKLKTMVPQKLVVRVRQSGTRAEIEATLDGVTLGTYSGERSRIVLPSWVKPNVKQITSGSLCGNLAEGYIELRNAVYRPLLASSPQMARFRHGLKAEIFEGKNFEKKLLDRIDPTLECLWDWGAPAREAPVDQFSVRYSGWLRAPKSGLYKVASWSDDGVRVSINGKMVIDCWQLEKSFNEATVSLTEGPQSIMVEAFDHEASSWMSMLWQGPEESALSPIPSEALYPDEISARAPAKDLQQSPHGLTAEYFDKSFTTKLATQRVYQAHSIWYTGAPLPGLPTQACVRYTGVLVPPVSGEYQLVSAARTGMKVWFDRDLVMDASFPPKKSPVRLEAYKPYALKIEHINLDGQGSYYLHWISPGETKEVAIPPECLYPSLESVPKTNAAPMLAQAASAPPTSPPKAPPQAGTTVSFPQDGRFTAARSLTEVNQGAPINAYPWITPDGLSLYWTRETQNVDSTVMQATRSSMDAPFGDIKPVLRHARLASVSPDGLEVVCPFDANGDGKPEELCTSRRATTSQEFPTPQAIPTLAGLHHALGSAFSEDGQRLIVLAAPQPNTTRIIHRVERSGPGAAWGTPRAVTIPNTPPEMDKITWPSLASGKYLIFSYQDPTNRPVEWGCVADATSDPSAFANPRHMLLDGERFIVRGGRYCPATGELFYTHSSTTQPFDRSEIRVARAENVPVTLQSNPGDGWIDLFNGRDLTGWEVINNKGIYPNSTDAGWAVVDGAIECQTTDHGWLRTTDDFEDFDLELMFRFAGPGSSSLILRTRGPVAPLADGLWVDLKHSAAGGVALAKIDSQPRLLPPGEWNQIHIEARGAKYRIVVNGHITAEADLSAHHWAASLEQAGRIGLNNYKGYAKGISFRDIRIRKQPRSVAASAAMTEVVAAAPEVKNVPTPGDLATPEVRHGLKAEIFEGRNFEKKISEQIEPNVECFWELGAPAKEAPVDNFSVRFSGWLRAPKTGRYKLLLDSKDGARLKINHQTLIDNWKLKPAVAEGSVELTQDPQPIEVEVFHADQHSWVSLYWQPAGTATVCIIPATALFPDLENARSKATRSNLERTGLVAEYFDKTFSRRLATDRVYRIEEIWLQHSPRWGLPTNSGARYTGILVPPVSGQYKLIAGAREQIRVWLDDKPTLESKGIGAPQNAVVDLEANRQYEIRVEVLTTNHGAHYLHWIPPNTTTEVRIPPECLFPNKAAVRLATVTPTAQHPAEEKPAPWTVSDADRATIERGLAQLKVADEAAGKKLLKAFDDEILKVRSASKVSADERVVRIKSLEAEKSFFEQHGHIPFSLAVRTETLKYLREFTEARTDVAKVYDRLIETSTKQKRDELASRFRTERDIALGPKVIAIWRTTEISGGKKADWSIWSNGSVGKADRQFVWNMDQQRFTIHWRPDPQWVDTIVTLPDSMKADIFTAKGERTITGERVAP